MILSLTRTLRVALSGHSPVARLIVCLFLCLYLCGPSRAEEPLTQAEFDEFTLKLEATIVADADGAKAERLARDLYALVLRDFGADSRQVVAVERLIVLAVVAQSHQDEAVTLGQSMMAKANRILSAEDALLYKVASVYIAALKVAGETDQAMSVALSALDEAERWLPPDAMALQELRLVLAGVAGKADRPDLAEAAFQQIDAALAGREDADALAMRALALASWAPLVAEFGDPVAAVPLYRMALEAVDREFASLSNPRMMPLRLALVAGMADGLLRIDDRAGTIALLRPEIAAVAGHYGPDSMVWADLAYPLAVALAGDEPGAPGAAEALDLLVRVVAIYQEAYDPRTVDLLLARLNLAMLQVSLGQGKAALDQVAAMGNVARPEDREQIVYILHRAEESGSIPREAAVDAMLRWLQTSGSSGSSGAAVAQSLLEQRLAAGTDEGAAALRAYTDLGTALNRVRGYLSVQMTLPRADRDAQAVADLRAEESRLSTAETAARGVILRDFPRLALTTGAAALSLDQIRARLGPDDALVVIDTPRHATDPGVIVAVSRTAVDWHTFQVPVDQIEGAVARLRGGIDLRLGVRSAVPMTPQGSAPAQPFDLEAAHWMYQQTLGQVAGVTAGKTHLLVDLRGAVAALPPHLMLVSPPLSGDMAGADWLIRHHAVTVLPAVASLPPAEVRAAPGTGFLAFADPVYAAGNGDGGNLVALPETAAEVRDVGLALGQGDDRLRLGPEATEAAVKRAALDGIGTLYFATHGLVAGDQVGDVELDQAALALTPGDGQDGLLTASEIIDLQLDARVVVLSACNTASGGVQGAEALSGLVQAFLYAGARGLLVSHWPVESRSAARLMTDTFRLRAADPGAGMAAAQRRAMLAMIDRPSDPRWSHPAYWAPFVLVGAPD